MRFAESDAGAGEQRVAQMEAHKAHLRNGEGKPDGFRILASGPMSASDGGPPAALVIAEAHSLEDVIAFSDADPFVVHGSIMRSHFELDADAVNDFRAGIPLISAVARRPAFINISFAIFANATFNRP